MADEVREIEAGGLRFSIEYRNFGGDRGPAVRVWGPVGRNQVQVLRFDCFEDDPHYHYDPDNRNFHLHLNPETVPDPVAWSLGELQVNLPTMLRTAGFDKLAAKVDTAAVTAVLPDIQRAITELQAAAG